MQTIDKNDTLRDSQSQKHGSVYSGEIKSTAIKTQKPKQSFRALLHWKNTGTV